MIANYLITENIYKFNIADERPSSSSLIPTVQDQFYLHNSVKLQNRSLGSTESLCKAEAMIFFFKLQM